MSKSMKEYLRTGLHNSKFKMLQIILEQKSYKDECMTDLLVFSLGPKMLIQYWIKELLVHNFFY